MAFLEKIRIQKFKTANSHTFLLPLTPMAKTRREKEYSSMDVLRKAWQKFSDEQLLLMKYSPRGYSDPLFKKALNQELKSRGLEKLQR